MEDRYQVTVKFEATADGPDDASFGWWATCARCTAPSYGKPSDMLTMVGPMYRGEPPRSDRARHEAEWKQRTDETARAACAGIRMVRDMAAAGFRVDETRSVCFTIVRNLVAVIVMLMACGPDAGVGSPCDGPEDCLAGLTCVEWPAGDPGRCLPPCDEDCEAECVGEDAQHCGGAT